MKATTKKHRARATRRPRRDEKEAVCNRSSTDHRSAGDMDVCNGEPTGWKLLTCVSCKKSFHLSGIIDHRSSIIHRSSTIGHPHLYYPPITDILCDCLYVYMSQDVCPSVCRICMSACLRFCRSVYLYICIYLSVSLSVHLSVHLCVCLYICLKLSVHRYLQTIDHPLITARKHASVLACLGMSCLSVWPSVSVRPSVRDSGCL